MRPIAAACGILGGGCLVVRHLVGDLDVLQWVGFGLLAVAAFVIGLNLVAKAPLWLQAIVGFGVVGLAGSVLATLQSEFDADVVAFVVGIVAVVVFALLAPRWAKSRPARPHGSHSR